MDKDGRLPTVWCLKRPLQLASWLGQLCPYFPKQTKVQKGILEYPKCNKVVFAAGYGGCQLDKESNRLFCYDASYGHDIKSRHFYLGTITFNDYFYTKIFS